MLVIIDLYINFEMHTHDRHTISSNIIPIVIFAIGTRFANREKDNKYNKVMLYAITKFDIKHTNLSISHLYQS